MTWSDVSLSCGARSACERLGISEIELRRARAQGGTEHARPAYLVVRAELPDGRAVVMSCRHDHPEHVVSVRQPDE